MEVYEQRGGIWEFCAKLSPPDGGSADNFGGSIAIAGPRIAVGAPNHIEPGGGSGAVYIFSRVAQDWELEQKIVPIGLTARSRAGASVALDSQRLVLGDFEGPVSASNGLAWVYRLDVGGVWAWEHTFEFPNDALSPMGRHRFGYSVAISGERLVIGAPHPNGSPTGYDRRGYTFAYQLTPSGWRLEGRLQPAGLIEGDSSATPGYGNSVSIDAATAIASAPGAGVEIAGGAVIPHGSAWTFDLSQPLFTILDNPPPETPIHQGGAAHISITATGPEPLTYRWYRANTPVDGIYPFISGADTPTLTIDPVFPIHFGSEGYVCRVTSPCGTLSSIPSALVEVPPPPCEGDANNDGFVNMADISVILMQWGAQHADTNGPGDANHDGHVNFDDITTTIARWTSSCL